MGEKAGKTINQGHLGKQEYLVITEVPAGAPQSWVGQQLRAIGVNLTVAGDYYCDANIEGLGEVYVHLKATLGAGTLTSDVYTVHMDGVTRYQEFAGDGALVSNTLQTSSLTTVRGERRVRVKLTAATSPNIAVNTAELNGPRK